jgi:hypothetical protein
MKKGVIIIVLLLFGYQANSQVLISLLFGDKLNSENIEFGLEGGFNFASLDGVSSKSKRYFNIGFYFDFNIKQDPTWVFNTGVIVKSTMGAKDIEVYSLNDEDLDSAFEGGTIERRISYWDVPFVLKRKINDRIYIELGGMAALRYTATQSSLKPANAQAFNSAIRKHTLPNMTVKKPPRYFAESSTAGRSSAAGNGRRRTRTSNHATGSCANKLAIPKR